MPAQLRKTSSGGDAEVEGASADMRLQMGQWAGPEGSVWLKEGTEMAGKEGGKEGAGTLGKRGFKLYRGCV